MPVPPPPHAKCVYQNPRHQVWEWDQELYDGSHTLYSCIVREDTAAVIPFLDPDTVLLILESQPGRENPFWDVPGGCVESTERDPLVAAQRELLEETGYRAAVLQQVRTKRFEGMTRFEEFVFLAKGLTQAQEAHPEAGEKIELRPTPWKDVVALALQGGMRRPEVMLTILAMEFDPEMRAMKERFLTS
jgi:8-oxo-dGTP pyrophosphatase MutT (NUDIX family)